MTEQDDEKSPSSLRYYAPRRPRDADGADGGRPEQPTPPAMEGVTRTEAAISAQLRRDPFSEAVARVERQRLDPEFVVASPFMEARRTRGTGVKLAIVTTTAVVVLVAALFASPMSGLRIRAASAWSAVKSAYLTGAPASSAPTLIVRGNSGASNAQLDLGVSVEHPSVGMVVIISKLPLGTRITAGRRLGAEEWRVPALDVADAAIVPPADYAGDMNLPLELHDADGATLVKSFVHLSWAAPPAPPIITGSTVAAPDVKMPSQEPPPVPASPPAAAVAPALPADPVPAWTPNEVAAFVRRAQELLASGEVQAARLQLLRAAEARDARAALLLAKTYDPVSLKQFGVSDAGTDLAQARIWYQHAREWGSPEAQRQLDALASYPRR